MAPYWYWLSFLAPLLALSLILQSAWFKGKLGELKVHVGLSFLLDRKIYRLVKNVTLPFGGGTAQIDHLVVSPYGIFVIETKNVRGWIFGQPDQEQWTQVIYRFKKRFKNPLFQNNVHVEAVRKLLGLEPEQVHNVVVFAASCTIKTYMPPEVVQGISGLVGFIRARHDQLFTEDEIRYFIDCILSNRLTPGFRTERTHARYAKQRKIVASTANPGIACPRCGGPMIEQTNRRTGEHFFGCRRFPRCKGVRSLH
jgi:restriction system protein